MKHTIFRASVEPTNKTWVFVKFSYLSINAHLNLSKFCPGGGFQGAAQILFASRCSHGLVQGAVQGGLGGYGKTILKVLFGVYAGKILIALPLNLRVPSSETTRI